MSDVDPYVEWSCWNQYAGQKKPANVSERIHAWDRLSVVAPKAATLWRIWPSRSGAGAFAFPRSG